MPLVKFIGSDGIETELDVPQGWTLMQAATLNGVEGIDGECGGSLACATCHCYIEGDKFALLPSNLRCGGGDARTRCVRAHDKFQIGMSDRGYPGA